MGFISMGLSYIWADLGDNTMTPRGSTQDGAKDIYPHREN